MSRVESALHISHGERVTGAVLMFVRVFGHNSSSKLYVTHI